MQLEATVITIFAGQGPGQLGTGDRHRRFKGRIDDNPQLLVGITAPVQRQLRPLQGTGGGQFHVEGIIRAAVGVTGFFLPRRLNPLDHRSHILPRIRRQHPHHQGLSQHARGVVKALDRRLDLDITGLRRLKIKVGPAVSSGDGNAGDLPGRGSPVHGAVAQGLPGVIRSDLHPQAHTLVVFQHRVIRRLEHFTKSQPMMTQGHLHRIDLGGVLVDQVDGERIRPVFTDCRAVQGPGRIQWVIHAPGRGRHQRLLGIVVAGQRRLGADPGIARIGNEL